MMKKLLKIIILISCGLYIITGCGNEIYRRFRAAKKLARSNKPEDWEKAIKEFEDIINIQVEAREYQGLLYRKLAERHMQYEHWNDAVKYLKKALEILPNEGILHYRLGVCYSQLSRSADNKKRKEFIKKAEQEYKLALKLNPDLTGPLFGLGIIYFYVYNDYDKGIEYMTKVLQKDPRNIDAHFALGRFYYEMGDLSKSLEFYKALLGLVPEDSEEYEQVKKNIARIYKEMGTP